MKPGDRIYCGVDSVATVMRVEESGAWIRLPSGGDLLRIPLQHPILKVTSRYVRILDKVV